MNGVYKPGEKLPTEDNLAKSLGVSRVTIRSALSNLETLGFIQRIHGSGTYVSNKQFKVEAQLNTLESFHPRMAARVGRTSRMSHLSIQECHAEEGIAPILGLRTGESIISIKRLVHFDDVAVVYLQDYLPKSVFDGDIEDLKANFASVIDYFDGHDGKPTISWCDSDFESIQATELLSILFDINVGDPLFQLDEIFYTEENRLVSMSRNYILPMYFKFHIRRQVIHG